MPETRLFRNTGTQMFADDPDQLDDLDLGIVLLYADTGSNRVCSYLRARLGQPIQATAECVFGDAIDLSAIEPGIEAVSPDRMQLVPAPEENSDDRRWILQGLSEPPLPVHDDLLEVIRFVLDPERPILEKEPENFIDRVRQRVKRNTDEDTQIDLAVRDLCDASRLFRTLVEELRDFDVTIAVSKAGRVGCLSDTDIVVNIDDSVAQSEARVVPTNGTEERLSTLQTIVRQRRLARVIHPHIDTVVETYETELEVTPPEDEDLAEYVLQKELESAFSSLTDLRVVPRQSLWTLPLATGVAGLVLGFTAGFSRADWLAQVATVHLAELRADVLWAFGEVSTFAAWSPELSFYGPVAACSVLLFVGSVLLMRHFGTDVEHDLSGSTAGRDLLIRLLRLTAVVSAALLLLSITLFTVV